MIYQYFFRFSDIDNESISSLKCVVVKRYALLMDKPIQKKKPSVRSLAKATGLSVATISRVLNKSDSVHEKTRNRVLDALREHGYVMNSAARALATNRTRTIGAVVPTLSHSIFARFLNSVEKSLAEQGYALVVATSGGNIEAEGKRARELLDIGTEALILSGAIHDLELLSTVKEHEIPVICTSICDTELTVPAIGYDNTALAEEAMDFLYQQGHRSIYIVHGLIGNNDRTQLRLQGIRNAVQKNNMTVSYSEASLNVAGGVKAATEYMQRQETATACLCLSDILALGMLFEFGRCNISVPEQISIMGFDDLDWAAYSHPALTTIGLPTISMGEKTAAAIVQYLDKKVPIETVKLDANIIERETVRNITLDVTL